jgi:hypothetical protein
VEEWEVLIAAISIHIRAASAQSQADPLSERQLALEERIDNIGKKAKVVRRKKKGDDVDVSAALLLCINESAKSLAPCQPTSRPRRSCRSRLIRNSIALKPCR